MKKNIYEAPHAELIEMEHTAVLCASGGPVNSTGTQAYSLNNTAIVI